MTTTSSSTESVVLPTVDEPEAPRRTWAGDRTLALSLALLRLGPGLILLVLVLVMSALSPYFLSERNLQNLGQQTAIIAMLAIGQLMVIIVRGIDISVGSVVALSAVVGVTVAHTSGVGVILMMLATGAAVGLFNGFFIVKGRLPQPLIVTLASLGIASGMALLISNGEVTPEIPSAVAWAGEGFVGPVPASVLLVAGIGLLFWMLTAKTLWGRWTYAVGGDPEAARRLGLPVNKIVMVAYLLCSIMASVAGILSAGRTGTADPFSGNLLELDAITAVVIGGASLFGGRGSVWGAVVGALILTTIRNGLDLQSVSPYWQIIALGAVVLVALELDVIRGALEEKIRIRQTRRDA